MDICQYRNMKTSKSVAGAARALLNLYRDIHPELLHKSLRGKEAAIAVQRGETDKIAQFGEQRVDTDIAGIDLLVAAKKRKRMEADEEDGEDYDDGEDLEDGSEFDDEEDGEEDFDDSEDEEEEGEEKEEDEEEEEDEDGRPASRYAYQERHSLWKARRKACSYSTA